MCVYNLYIYLYSQLFYFENPNAALVVKLRPGSPVLFTYILVASLESHTVSPPHTEPQHERSFSGCVCAPPRAPLDVLRIPVHRVPVRRRPGPDPPSRRGGAGGALRGPPVRLGLDGHRLHPPAGGGAPVLQRVLGERRAGGLRYRGPVHVPDPDGDLGPGSSGDVEPRDRVTSFSDPSHVVCISFIYFV